jgi:23S rRNA (guanine2445-N2)-methyltransferase / 23S rRNA (guanine2069-N7)-methyltransferase
MLQFFATTPKGCEALLADELRALGADDVKETRAGVAFKGRIETGYRACLWSRVASRVLLRLTRFEAPSADALYEGALAIRWSDHLGPDDTLAVDVSDQDSVIGHSRFAAQRIKDAVVDQMRAQFGTRPSVDTARPAVRINAFLSRSEATLGIDLAGESLHRRGYRDDAVAAPLKENLAAAILLRARWPEIARDGGGFVDLMCGGGTLPIEAALIAADIAPGLQRDYFGFFGWRGHDAAIWTALKAEAEARRTDGLARLPPIAGFDADASAIRAAKRNVRHAGLEGRVRLAARALADCTDPEGGPGLVIANPPYGERLGGTATAPSLARGPRLDPIGEREELALTYRQLGAAFRDHFRGWQGAVFTSNRELGHELGLRAKQAHRFYNGSLECVLLRFDLRAEPRAAGEQAPSPERTPRVRSEGAQMFANRLEKNLRTLGKWAAKEGIHCYRLYDADMPEYAFAIDLYAADGLYAHVQEYAPPASVQEGDAARRRKEVLAVVPDVLGIPRAHVAFKTRARQRGHAQYERQAERGEFLEVAEHGARFLVNLHDYLDTGLFLDHRPTRLMIRELAPGRRFLNLYGYTGTATVHAALGGAKGTTTVDLSNTYLDWAARNFELNGMRAPAHQLVRADVREWLESESRQFDLIFMDPPTFSISKRMTGTLDIQRDHAALIHAATARLAHGGVLIFSTNARRFRLDAGAFGDLAVEDISARTIARDFARNPRIHQSYRITKRDAG